MKTINMFILVPFVSFTVSGCVGYQRVIEKDLVGEKFIVTKQVSALIIGTSGQAINTGDMTIEKKDTSDVAAGLLRDGISTGLSLAKEAKATVAA